MQLPDRISMTALLRAGFRRSPWRSAAGLLVALLAAAAILGSAQVLSGMDQTLASGLSRLGADLVLVPKGGGEAARQLLIKGSSDPLPAAVDVVDWKQKLKDGKVVGVKSVQGWSLVNGGAGEPSGEAASVLLISLERWASPLVAVMEVTAAIPEAEVLAGEQTTRNVNRDLKPLVKYLGAAAVVGLLAALLMTGLLTSIRVAERRGELGMMRAMGATRAFLIRLTLAESGLLALAGALVGVLLAGVALVVAGPGAERPVDLLLYSLVTLAVSVAVSLLAALGPALRAARMDPLDAVRRGR